jgi:hypothetical protein
MTITDAKESVLETDLRAFIGVHPKVTTKKLKIPDNSLRRCVGSDSPMEFWRVQEPSSVWLRLVAMRLLSAKPHACAVECLRNVFGDVCTKKRRSMGKERVAQLVHARMNMQLLPHDKMPEMGFMVDVNAPFNSIFEAVAHVDDEEEVAAAAAVRTAIGSPPDEGASDDGDSDGCFELSDGSSACADDF